MQKWNVFDFTRYSGDFWICWLRIWRRRGSEADLDFGCITNLLLIITNIGIYYIIKSQ